MKYCILVFIMITFFFTAMCQNYNNSDSSVKHQTQINTLVELGGNGIYLSMGFEQENFKYNDLKNSFRVGLALTEYLVFTEYNFDFGRKNNYFEIGAGPSLHFDENNINLYIFGRMGYRYNSDTFIFRAAFTPFLSFENGVFVYMYPYLGISIGIPIRNKRRN